MTWSERRPYWTVEVYRVAAEAWPGGRIEHVAPTKTYATRAALNAGRRLLAHYRGTGVVVAVWENRPTGTAGWSRSVLLRQTA